MPQPTAFDFSFTGLPVAVPGLPGLTVTGTCEVMIHFDGTPWEISHIWVDSTSRTCNQKEIGLAMMLAPFWQAVHDAILDAHSRAIRNEVARIRRFEMAKAEQIVRLKERMQAERYEADPFARFDDQRAAGL